MTNVAIIMSTTGRNISWLKESIDSINANITENINIDIFLHCDGCLIEGLSCYKIINSANKIGLGDSMNRLLLAIYADPKKYDFIARMDDDDTISKNKFEKQVAFMNDHKDIDFCSTLLQIMDENKKIINPEWEYARDDGRTIEERFLSGGCHIAHAATMFRSAMLYEKGHLWYNPLFKQVEDYDLWFRLIRLGYKYKLLPEYLYQYRTHSRQETRSNNHFKNIVCDKIHSFYRGAWKDLLC